MELMKKFFQNKKVQDVLSWVFGIAIVISIPYLIIGVLSAGLAFKPLGYLIIGTIYFVIGGSILAGIIDIYKNLNRRYRRIYKEEGRLGITKELRSYIKPALILVIFIIGLLGLMPKSFESFLGYLIILSFAIAIILSTSQGIYKFIKNYRRKNDKKKQ